jgi:muconate cycloisomerase
MIRSQISCIRAWSLAIPLRQKFAHAARERRCADPIVVQIELADGTCGYGETLPRDYVTGESRESVLEAIRSPFLDELLTYRPTSFPDALEQIAELPTCDDLGRGIMAARAGVELALLDAYSRHFGRPVAEIAGWMGVPGFGPPGSIQTVRYSGVLSGDDLSRLRGSIRKMRWYGLRDFKLKVGYPDDVERVRVAANALGGSPGGKTTLRLDANGAWSLERAVEVLNALKDIPVACVEQPLSKGNYEQLPMLKNAVAVSIMHDESLVTPADAECLIELDVADAFNIRLSKNGGYIPAMQLVQLARKHGVAYQLGCMVGETSILSAAGRRFLECVPAVRFAEGSYGRFLLSGDVTGRVVQFGCGGRVKPLSGLGWGVDVAEQALRRFAVCEPLELPL